jgi:hypothetical protein
MEQHQSSFWQVRKISRILIMSLRRFAERTRQCSIPMAKTKTKNSSQIIKNKISIIKTKNQNPPKNPPGEMLAVAEPLLEKNIHPTVIVRGYFKALADAIKCLEEIAIPVNVENHQELVDIVNCSIDTKFVSRWGSMISELAVKAAETVYEKSAAGKVEIDLKR